MRPGNAAWPRWDEFVKRLERWRSPRDHSFGRGGQCIGYTPWIGSHAFLHDIYEPLDEAQLATLESKLNVRFTPQMRGFYLNANGARLFGVISIRGLVGKIDRSMKGGIRQPVSLDYGSVWERPRDLAADDFVFGGLVGRTVVGQLVESRAGDVRLVHPVNGTDVALAWPNFDTFLFSEIDRLGLLHNAKGEFIADEHDRLPAEAVKWERKAR